MRRVAPQSLLTPRRGRRGVPDVTDPVCGMTFPEETAEEMGAFKVVRGGKTHWFCSSTCRDEFVAKPP